MNNTLGYYVPVPQVLIDRYGLITAAVWSKIFMYSKGRKGFCNASQRKMAQELGISLKTVWRAIQTLLKENLILDITAVEFNSEGITRHYKPNMDKVQNLLTYVTESSVIPEPASSDREPTSNVRRPTSESLTPCPVTYVTESHKYIKNKKNTNINKSAVEFSKEPTPLPDDLSVSKQEKDISSLAAESDAQRNFLKKTHFDQFQTAEHKKAFQNWEQMDKQEQNSIWRVRMPLPMDARDNGKLGYWIQTAFFVSLLNDE